MATVSMNAVHFYNPSSTVPLVGARYAAALQKYRLSIGISHHKESESYSQSYSQSRNVSKEISGKQDDPMGDHHIAADDDDDLPPLEEALRRTPHLEDSAEKPTNSALITQGTDKTSFLDGSSSSMPAQSSLLGHLNGSKGTCIDFALLQTKQQLIDAQSSQSYLMTTMTTTIIITMKVITMRIRTTRAAEASLAI
jgi:hypothetical protein